MSTKNRKNCENPPDDCSLTTTTRNNEPSARPCWARGSTWQPAIPVRRIDFSIGLHYLFFLEGLVLMFSGSVGVLDIFYSYHTISRG